MDIKKINELLKEIDGVEPIIDYQDPVTDKGHMFNQALANMYKEKGFRLFLTEAYKSALKSTALNSTDELSLAVAKSRAILLKEILIKSENAFNRSVRENQLKQGLQENINNAAQKGNKPKND